MSPGRRSCALYLNSERKQGMKLYWPLARGPPLVRKEEARGAFQGVLELS